jgi:FAD/FMN-containing dehydrogenase
MRSVSREIHGWGRYPRGRAELVRPERLREVAPPATGAVIARGQGRSYGDAAMSSNGVVMLTERLNRFLHFDEANGELTAEAGTTVAELLDVLLPRGFFPTVTPGTKHVSLGGCFAADVHGKNHHRDGAFAEHVNEIELVTADGERRRCSRQEDSELFWTTAGGMGLTGLITQLTLKLLSVESVWVIARNHPARDLDALFEMLEDDEYDDKYSVAWVDALARGARLGRGILTTGHHATLDELPQSFISPLARDATSSYQVPFDFPSWILNRTSLAAFNEIYFRRQSSRQTSFVASLDSFFYPLDRIDNWNRMYGSRGFTQYQCVLPASTSRRGLRLLLETLAASTCSSFLAVLKRFGPEDEGPLSFPMEGYTLALDLPMTGPELFSVLNRFDELVLEHGGRVYLAKDSRLAPGSFRRMYPRFDDWKRVKVSVDPVDRFSSDLSRRLEMGSRG